MNIIKLSYKMYYYCVIILFVMFLLYLIFKYLRSNIPLKELWKDYEQSPYNYQLNGADPLYFYRKDRFRKPYRYPLKYYKSYPTKHLSYLL